MYSIINNQTDLTAIVSLEEAKRHCNILDDNDDDHLLLLIDTCCNLAQTYCHKLLTIGSVTVESMVYNSMIRLPYGNVTSIDEVLLDDVESDEYKFHSISQKVQIDAPYSKINITYTCGYSSVPTPVKQGILMMISTLFNFRDDAITGFNVADIPLCSRRLLDHARYFNV